MKKSIIAGAGVMSLAAAAMPFAGVFATTTATDTVNVTVVTGCTATFTPSSDASTSNSNSGAVHDNITAANTYSLGSANGQTVLGGENGVEGTSLGIVCNGSKGWQLTATATDLVKEGDTKIAYGQFATNGDSVWSIKMTAATEATGGIVADTLATWNTFEDARGVAPVTLVTHAGASAATTDKETYTPHYKAFVSSSQVEGTYTGTVAYTFAEV